MVNSILVLYMQTGSKQRSLLYKQSHQQRSI